ncbi:MAG: DUF3365 domain-containing protein [Saprospiraceae bacterium]|nr:DUF3365 domain-containing protein [Saprospiraceae bacterium]
MPFASTYLKYLPGYATLALSFILGIIFLFGCKDQTGKSTIPPNDYLTLGDSITDAAQSYMLQRVSNAMQKGGPAHAVDYCSENALAITDSLSQKYDVTIRRLSDKNRNPSNALTEDKDKAAWQRLKSFESDFIEQDASGVVYYKPIKLTMPACLKCHGAKSDIAADALKLIDDRYPNDLATDYKMGELRGMWKVTFNKK